jgi:hypothetical protein
MYGYLWERKHNKAGVLFWVTTFKGITIYPLYRALQWALDGLALYWLYKTETLTDIAVLLIAIYFMTKEGMYYIYLWQFKTVKGYEQYVIKDGVINNENTYWLKRLYFAGWFLFPTTTNEPLHLTDYGFRARVFWFSFSTGWLILILNAVLNQNGIFYNWITRGY